MLKAQVILEDATLPECSHGVQFYNDSKFLAQKLYSYIAEGLVKGECGIIIGTPQTRTDVESILEQNGFDVRKLIITKQLTLLDAAETLSQFYSNGKIEPFKFTKFVGGLLTDLSKKFPKIRAYGEMVGLLWKEGNSEGTIHLEQQWNKMAETHSFSLLCGYSLKDFPLGSHIDAFEKICNSHTHVRSTENVSNVEPEETHKRIALLEQQARVSAFEIEKRKQVEAALKVQQKRLELLSQSLPALVGYVDTNLNYQYVNDEFVRFFKRPKTELLKSKLGELTSLETSERFQPHIQKVLRGEAVKFELPFKLAGNNHWVQANFVPDLDDDGRVQGFIVLGHDITEQKKTEDDLADAVRARDQFLATLSHELRTPLNVILGWVEILQNNELDSVNYRQALDTLERNARMQRDLIDDLLDISRITTGKYAVDLLPIEFRSLLESQLIAIRPRVLEKNIEIEMDVSLATAPLMGNTTRINQLILNLLTNAIKFTPVNGKVKISLSKDQKGEGVFSVSDNGIGIDSEFLPHVFEPLKQEDVRTTRLHGGLGLGLSIVKHIADIHGGTVRVDSEGRGKGAKFTLTFPLILYKKAALPQPAPQSTDLRGVRVMAVDDSQDVLVLIQLWLEKKGAEVLAVNSAEKAFEAFAKFRPDVLLTDIGMPGEDGYSLLRKIRALSPKEGGLVPAAALTAYARDEEKQEAYKAGFQTHLSKPVLSRSLEQAVLKLVAQRQI